MLDEIKAQELIAQGEDQHVELKREVPSKVRELSEEVCAPCQCDWRVHFSRS